MTKASASLLDRARALTPPRPDKRPVNIEQLGFTRTDEFGWLRDDNWQDVMRTPDVLKPEIRAHLDAENAYLDAVMQPLEGLQDMLFKEIKGRIKEDDASVPDKDGPFAYYTRFREGGQYPVFARRPAEGGEEQVLFDGDAAAKAHDYLDIATVAHSPDHQRIVVATDTKGSEYYTIEVHDLASGDIIATLTAESTGDIAWAQDSETLFWVWRDEHGRSRRVFRQRVSEAEATLVYEEADEGFFVSLGVSDAENWVMINAGGHTSNEVYLIDAHNPVSAPRLVAQRREKIEYHLTEGPAHWFIRTNQDGAVDFKLMTAPFDNPGLESWTDDLPHRPGVLLLGVESLRDWQVRMERENALPRIVVTHYASGEAHAISFEEEAYALGVSTGFEFDAGSVRFTYESPSTPEETYDYDLDSRTRTLRKRQEVPSGHDPMDYVVRRITAEGHDGAQIPVTILHHRSTPLDGSAPLMLYGYGSYGITIPAAFRVTPLSLVDRGMIYAIAHIRGSMARGYQWYLDGKLEKKMNTFRDFVAAGEALADKGYTTRGNIVAYGGSAGGLLVGAAANLAPDLFAGVIGAVPFVDVINTMSDPSLPLTPPEWPEWGNPLENAADYETMLAYSPYDQIEAKPYPHILATGGLTDPRVTYWEPTKWVARLRDRRTDDGLTLLKMNMGAGHGGASGRFDALKETALNWAFALMATGLASTEEKAGR